MAVPSGFSYAHSETPNSDATTLPLLSALFLIKFDQKVGYKVSWKRTLPGVELEGAVEFKALPSGLHTVKEDLVYFIQDDNAGLGAFVNGPASEAERNAHMVSVGILVPLSYGRLGRSWLHADNLMKLANVLVTDASQTHMLEKYWEEHQAGGPSAPSNSGGSDESTRPGAGVVPGSKNHSRNRALSSVTAVLPSDQALPATHPALSIIDYINTFGPLVFPLQRAALLRKRILFIGQPSVQRLCEFVYNLSILSTIPSSLADLLSPDTESYHRLRSLFNIGVFDIPSLEKEAAEIRQIMEASGGDQAEEIPPSYGWVACTTDEILSIKTKLYDIVVEIPPTHTYAPRKQQWPTIKTSAGTVIKASQRDLQRWRLLYRELSKTKGRPDHDEEGSDDGSYHDDADDNDNSHLLSRSNSGNHRVRAEDIDAPYDSDLIESTTWSQLAYSGFIWWASAGEKDASQSDEYESDYATLGDFSDFIPFGIQRPSPHRLRSRSSGHGESPDLLSSSVLSSAGAVAGVHTAIIAYFHRLTAGIFTSLAEIVDAADDGDMSTPSQSPDRGSRSAEHENNNGNDPAPVITIEGEDLKRMGLDAWSPSDRNFIWQLSRMYFGRETEVRGVGIDCCGMRM